MTETNFQVLDINELDNEQEMATPKICQFFLESPWYADISHVLLNLQAPPGLSRTKKRFLKMKFKGVYFVDRIVFDGNGPDVLLAAGSHT
jgi:hypothetical protein